MRSSIRSSAWSWEPTTTSASRSRCARGDDGINQKLAYKTGAWLYKLPRRLSTWLGAPQPSSEPENAYRPLEAREVRAALAGRYGASTRRSRGGQRSLTLYSAIPVRNQGKVLALAQK